jgi:hypothetical protein
MYLWFMWLKSRIFDFLDQKNLIFNYFFFTQKHLKNHHKNQNKLIYNLKLVKSDLKIKINLNSKNIPSPYLLS